MSGRSSGCATCRKRRIRCDEGRPECQRCKTHGVQCPGYRLQRPGDVDIIDLTQITAKRATLDYSEKEFRSQPVVRISTKSGLSSDANAPMSSSASCSHRSAHTPSHAQLWTDAIFHVAIAASLPTSLRSPSVMTTQIYSCFLEVYLPENAPMDHDDLFRGMASHPNEDAALVSALRALSLAAVGGSRKDELVVRQAGLEYGRALNLLAQAVNRPNFKPTDETLATTTVLAQCEFYNGISATGGWQKHLQGMHGMLAMGGPRNIQSRLALMLCSNSRHGALAAHLQSRRAALLGEKAWRRVLLRAPVIDETATFYNHALQVPGLLERKDNLDLQSPTIATEIEELLDDLFEQELSLRTWFETWIYRDQLTKETYYERKPIEHFTVFAALVTDRTFAEALWFPNFPFAYLASQYWATLHRLLEDKLGLYQLQQQLDLAWQPPADVTTIEAELITLADALCMCIPYFCEPVCSLVGQVGIFLPMAICMPYFARTQAWEKASWLLDMRQSVFVKGMVPPN